jgi:O-antigen ligase
MYLTVVIFHKFRGRNILLGALIILTILAIYSFPENVRQRLEYTFIPEYQETIKPAKMFGVTLDPSSSARLNDYNRLMGIWRKKPFLGYGLTGMGFVDGQYILVLIESGALGFTAFVLLLGAIFRNTLRIYRNSRDELYKGLALGFLGGHVGMMVHAITANTFVLIRVMEPYWFLAALVMIIPRLEKEQKDKAASIDAPAAPYPKNAQFLANYGNT